MSEDVGVGLDALADLSMPELLIAFGIAEPVDDDLRMTEPFQDRWRTAVEALADGDERRRAAADLYDEPADRVAIEFREEDQPFVLVDGRSTNNWITETAMVADLAAHRAIEDDRWARLDRNDRARVLKSFRVVLDVCPDCGGSVVPTQEVVTSCCRDWDVIAVRCLDCDARVAELPPPDPGGEAGGSDPRPPRSGGFTR